jgi:uncharacterized protein YodC (DUF2158 family)
MPWRFSFRALMTTVTLLMLGFAAMVSPWPVMANASALACQFLLCIAVICAFILPRRQKPFWIGFAVVGLWYWSSLTPVDVGPPGGQPLPASGVTVWSSRLISIRGDSRYGNQSSLPTTAALDWLQTMVHTRLSVGSSVQAQWNNGGYYPGVIDEVDSGMYLIRWMDGSSSPKQWTSPAQITQINGSYNFRLAGHTIFCGLFGILGGMFAIWLASVTGARERSDDAENEDEGN